MQLHVRLLFLLLQILLFFLILIIPYLVPHCHPQQLSQEIQTSPLQHNHYLLITISFLNTCIFSTTIHLSPTTSITSFYNCIQSYNYKKWHLLAKTLLPVALPQFCYPHKLPLNLFQSQNLNNLLFLLKIVL